MIHPKNPITDYNTHEIKQILSKSILLFNPSNLIIDFISTELLENMQNNVGWVRSSYGVLKNNDIYKPLAILMNIILETNQDWVKSIWIETNTTHEMQKHLAKIIEKRMTLLSFFKNHHSDIASFYAIFDKLFFENEISLSRDIFHENFIELTRRVDLEAYFEKIQSQMRKDMPLTSSITKYCVLQLDGNFVGMPLEPSTKNDRFIAQKLNDNMRTTSPNRNYENDIIVSLFTSNNHEYLKCYLSYFLDSKNEKYALIKIKEEHRGYLSEVHYFDQKMTPDEARNHISEIARQVP